MQTGVGRVVRMRDEDRQPSKRVFPLLQNLDLENVVFQNISKVGNPITIQDMNEQEMVDLIIVNLARLCCAGEWTGLLSAGGGGNEFNAELTKYNWDGDGDPIRLLCVPPYGNGNKRTYDQTLVNDNQLILFPFIAPVSGTISELDFYVQGASESGAYNVGFYSDVEGVPETFLGEFVMAVTSIGNVTQTTSSDDVVTVRGTQYWVSFYGDNIGGTQPDFAGLTHEGFASPLCVGGYGTSGVLNAVYFTGSSSGNATITDWTLYEPAGVPPLNLGVKW